MCINPKILFGFELALVLGLKFIHIFEAFKEPRNNGEGLYLNKLNCR